MKSGSIALIILGVIILGFGILIGGLYALNGNNTITFCSDIESSALMENFQKFANSDTYTNFRNSLISAA